MILVALRSLRLQYCEIRLMLTTHMHLKYFNLFSKVTNLASMICAKASGHWIVFLQLDWATILVGMSPHSRAEWPVRGTQWSWVWEAPKEIQQVCHTKHGVVRSGLICPCLCRYWNYELERKKRGKSPRLLYAVIRCFWLRLCLHGLLLFSEVS